MNTLRPSGPSVNSSIVERWTRKVYAAAMAHVYGTPLTPSRSASCMLAQMQHRAACTQVVVARSSLSPALLHERLLRSMQQTARAIARGHARELALAPWRDAVGEVDSGT